MLSTWTSRKRSKKSASCLNGWRGQGCSRHCLLIVIAVCGLCSLFTGCDSCLSACLPERSGWFAKRASTESKQPCLLSSLGVTYYGSFDCVAVGFADGNSAQDDIYVGGRMDFQVNGETYFLSLAENERQWVVLVATAEGARPVPVYVDGAETEDLTVVVEDRERRGIVN